MGALRTALVGIVPALAVGGGLYWLGTHPFLATTAGIVWGGALAMTAHLAGQHPDFRTGDSWRDSRWTGASVLLTVVAVNGPLVLPLAFDVQVGVAVLLGGVGLGCYVAGMLDVLDRSQDGVSHPAGRAEETARPGAD